MRDTRPISLNLFKIKFAMTAIISILHRMSGMVLFLLIPLMLWVLDYSLRSEHGFILLKSAMFTNMIGKGIIWLILSTFSLHVMAGVRHLLMDMGWFESLVAARLSTKLVFFLLGLMAIFIGVWLW